MYLIEVLRVHAVDPRLFLQVESQVLLEQLYYTFVLRFCQGGGVRADQDVGQIPQRALGRQGFGGEHVEDGLRRSPVSKGIGGLVSVRGT